ncbi:MAG: PAS domain-containing protein [Anaerolineae bacterium]|nr:PAS domain-containing protein [Anaerolineae bacterium]
MKQPQSDPVEITDALSRVNELGEATETFFSRLYKSIGRKQKEADRARYLLDQSRQLTLALRQRDHEIEQLHGILAAISEGIIMQDNEGRLVLVNDAARELMGSMKSFWQSELGALFSQYSDMTHLDSELVPLGEPKRVQLNNRILGAQVAAVADGEGNRLGTMIVLRDVTRDALTDRLKDQFITAISHELRTPMAVIKGMSEVIMAQGEEGPPNRKLLETLSRNVDILDRMIVELLDISELTTGNFSIRRENLPLEPLIWNVVRGLQPEIKRAGHSVSVMLRPNEKLTVEGDDPRLRWALGHLLQNSIRYTETGGHIVLTARRTSDDQIAIQIVDTGVGIAEKDLPHIFDRFYRGEPRTSAGKLLDPRGLGQGLFIARMVAEAHGGYVNAQSHAGQGSLFTIVLPAAG